VCDQSLIGASHTEIDPLRFQLSGSAGMGWADVGNGLCQIDFSADCIKSAVYWVSFDYGAQTNDGADDDTRYSCIVQFRLCNNGNPVFTWAQTFEIFTWTVAGGLGGTNEYQVTLPAPFTTVIGNNHLSLQYRVTYGNIGATAHINESETQVHHIMSGLQ